MFQFVWELCLLILRATIILCNELSRCIRVSRHNSEQQNNQLNHPARPQYSRLSKPPSTLRPAYDVVVIGSGYGGGVAASRMARASPSQSVCVLEMGKEHWPGEYPTSFRNIASELCFTGQLNLPFCRISINLGKRTGLYRWIIGRASSIFMGIGLGGTSLVNAGVFLRASEEVMQSSAWPEELRKPKSLDKYYERAEAMLEPVQYPDHLAPPQKFAVFLEQAQSVGLIDQFQKVRQTTSFTDRTNSVGVTMRANTLNGQDCLGSNDGSKSTTLATYLTDAHNWGAEIFCGCEVSHIRKRREGGYIVFFRRLDTGNQSQDALLWVVATKCIFLGAGSVGTTEILVRSQKKGLSLSSKAGTGISANGSMLAFGYDLDARVNALGRSQPSADPPGPTITAMIDCRTPTSLEKSFIVQEGMFPSVMAQLFRLVHHLLHAVRPKQRNFRQRLKRIVSRTLDRSDALQNSQVYLVLGHDNAGGRMELHNNRPFLDMRGIHESGHFNSAREILIKMTHVLSGTFKSQGMKVCVHPLGGMGMAGDGTARTGATNQIGEVFSGEGSIVHNGLAVVDAACVPTSLGANPLATITALAERSVEKTATKAGLIIDYTTSSPAMQACQRADQHPDHISFSEVMKGHLMYQGRRFPTSLHVNIKAMKGRASFEGVITGTVRCAAISTDLLLIRQGVFRLFETDSGAPMRKRMSYELDLVTTSDEHFRFLGLKFIDPGIAFSPRRTRRATTTMAVTVSNHSGQEIATGVLHLTATNFLRQLNTFTAAAPTRQKTQQLFWDFIWTFSINILGMIFVLFASPSYPPVGYTPPNQTSERLTRPSPDARYTVTSKDGVETVLRMWNPSPSAKVQQHRDLLLIPGGAITHEIYTLSTIKRNAIEHFQSLGYHCWCITHRAATTDPAYTHRGWTTYDARLDIEAAIRKIRQVRGEQRIMVVAHCVGSGALACGLLDGTIPSSWISGVVASQFFLHPLVSPLNRLKARLPLLGLYRWLGGEWFSCHSAADDTWFQRTLNFLLRFYPQSSREELCNSNLCHRTQLPFGRLWNHRNLTRETHEKLHDVFSGVSTNAIAHLASMGLKATLTDNQGKNLVTDENVQRLEGIPIFLLSGADNQTYSPDATLLTYKRLQDTFGKEWVKRAVFEGLGHLDCWMSDAAGSVFEAVGKELERMGSR